jgi:3-phosphoshikimate 1-carboxyvinyltransferase
MNSTDIVSIDPCGAVNASIRPPGSKSITNRALICAALARGNSLLHGVLESEDTQVMIGAWQQLGLDVQHDRSARTLHLAGCEGRLPNSHARIFVGNSGTTVRFLTAALCACHGEFYLDGVPRMRQRPIGDLIEALEQLGASIERKNVELPDCPPLQIHASGLRGGRARVKGSISSQFLSGLMMAAPLASTDVVLEIEDELVSVPYVRMTAAVMRSFGARVDGSPDEALLIDCKHPYVATQYTIEPDASAASYFWASAAITGGRATVQGLSGESLQGDVGFCKVLQQMGCAVHYEQDQITVEGPALRGVDVDMSDISDTVQTLAAVALFAEGRTTVRGVAHNRVKETDRIGDLATELRKLGATVDEKPDGLVIEPPKNIQPARIATYGDHRMAMSLALVGLRVAGMEISDPQCTAKTYPNYWEDLQLFSGCRVHWSH